MKRAALLASAFGLSVALAFVVMLTGAMPCGCDSEGAPSSEGGAASPAESPAVPATGGDARPARDLPRLLDLGSKTCIPCKMMAPILEELKEDYRGRLVVEFVDVRERPEVAQQHGISVIPTQIFFDPDGKELWRHEGFLGKEDILAKWKELGYDF
ncbi:MAG: thioredoxin family protein [Phycisphaerae bacterium]